MLFVLVVCTEPLMSQAGGDVRLCAVCVGGVYRALDVSCWW